MPPKARDSQRLDRRVAQATGLSRTQAQHAIRAGDVRVDGQAETNPARPVAHTESVEYGGTRLVSGFRYYMLHKPAGVVCATRDRQHRTVLDVLNVPNRHGLHVAGRLDLDTTGLVLITDDGDWSHRITSPRHKLPKSYRATLAEPLTADGADRLRHGVTLRGESKPCAPARIDIVTPWQVCITIPEGRYHQVKRMFAAIGNRVLALHRERIGPLVLDPALAEGESRSLLVSEISLVPIDGEPDQ